jgi:hypothetical protein
MTDSQNGALDNIRTLAELLVMRLQHGNAGTRRTTMPCEDMTTRAPSAALLCEHAHQSRHDGPPCAAGVVCPEELRSVRHRARDDEAQREWVA